MFRQCSVCSDSVQTFQTMFRICSNLSDNVQNLFRNCSECSDFSDMFRQCSESVQNFQSMFRHCSECSDFQTCSDCSESVQIFSEFLAQKLVYSELLDFVVSVTVITIVGNLLKRIVSVQLST